MDDLNTQVENNLTLMKTASNVDELKQENKRLSDLWHAKDEERKSIEQALATQKARES